MGEELRGRRIVVPETRELAVLVAILEERGAVALPCPLVAIRDLPDPALALEWLRRFIARPGDDLILLTGEALRRLVALADRAGVKAGFVAALAAPRKITRGPKPVRALREIGLDADVAAPVATSAGVIEALRTLALTGRRVGVALYPDSDHRELLGFLGAAGAAVDAVLPYVYASATDDEKVLEVIDRMAAGEAEAIAFTSSPQVRRFFAVADRAGRGALARAALARVLVAAVGPVVAGELAAAGARVDVVPANATYFMKPLVRGLAEAFAARAAALDDARALGA
jgi:uroporphyrinogen-III synthase